ncbi:MAG TPA: hypothetical protein VFM18_17925 [Methanosarcina sp.]|nr:hypothetical protein [Methanosarcina sp.]
MLKIISRLHDDYAGEVVEFHHGCCIGADSEAHHIAVVNRCHLVFHPPINQSKANLSLICDEERPAKEYLDRNHDIVNETDWMIACPKSQTEELRSGTWATVRYARKQKKQIVIIYPDGSVILE